MNIISVRAERTREIGIRKLLGETRYDTAPIFSSKRLCCARIGDLIGIALGPVPRNTLANQAELERCRYHGVDHTRRRILALRRGVLRLYPALRALDSIHEALDTSTAPLTRYTTSVQITTPPEREQLLRTAKR